MKTVFIDTNEIDNSQSLTCIFGNRSELQRLSNSCHIMIPEAVFDELLVHKENKFETERNQLRANSLLRRAEIDLEEVASLTFDTLREEIINGENIEFDVCPREDPETFMQKFYERALFHQPPFYKGSDRGFKDACVASSIDRYLSENPEDAPVYLLTSDKKFTEYFDDRDNVLVVKDFDELVEEGERVTEEQEGITEPAVKSEPSVLNDEEFSRVESLISELGSSPNFIATHAIIGKLAPYAEDLTTKQKSALLKAAVENNQVCALLKDEDVHTFFLPLFEQAQDTLSDSQYRSFVNQADLPLDRVDAAGNIAFSNCERKAYTEFVDSFIDSIASRSYSSRIKSDADAVLAELSEYLSMVLLDAQLLRWPAIHDIFIEGEITSAQCACMSADVLQSFANLLRRGTDKKRDLVLQMLAARFDLIEEEMPRDPYEIPF